MDLLQELKSKISAQASDIDVRGLESVLLHIQLAERHHNRAKKERDEHLYTDVIYRTNHAFEGVLKEAHVILAEATAGGRSAYEIEEYLLRNAILKSRVADLLKNYRTHWRNPSTHDHQLFFSEQESFLAIVTVTAFATILVDQIIEKVAYDQTRRDLERVALRARDRIEGYDALAPIDKVSRLLVLFAEYYIENFSNLSLYPRSTSNAQMAAFFAKFAPDVTISRDIQKGTLEAPIRFDLLVHLGKESVIIQTHEARAPEYALEDHPAVTDLSRQLTTAKLDNGIVFFYPGAPDHSVTLSISRAAGPQIVEIYSENIGRWGEPPNELPEDTPNPPDFDIPSGNVM
jgi:hypothetical protein